MGRPSGAHTHPPSGLSVAGAVVVGGLVLWAISRRSPAVHKAGHLAGELMRVVLISALSVVGLAVLAGAALAIVAVRRRREPRQVERGYTATVSRGGHATGQEMPRQVAAPRSRPAAPALPPPSVSRLLPPPPAPPLDRMPPAAGPREVHYHVHVDTPEGAQAVARALREHDH